jgi:hypothetical protein
MLKIVQRIMFSTKQGALKILSLIRRVNHLTGSSKRVQCIHMDGWTPSIWLGAEQTARARLLRLLGYLAVSIKDVSTVT